MNRTPTILFLLSFFQLIIGNAQFNYVPNPSFEDHTSCPSSFSEINKCVNWNQATKGTSDYFLNCGTSSTVSTPNNVIGNQEPRTGLAYAGIICYSTTSIADYKEYLEVKLKSKLIEGITYKVSFHVSLAEHVSTYAIKNLGFVLSPWDVGLDWDYQTIENVPMSASNPQFLNNTSEWVKLEFSYKALGEEEYLTIGNFHYSNETEAQYFSSSGDGFAYYFIDDVSVGIDYSLLLDDGVYGNGYDSSNASSAAYYLEGGLMDVLIPNVVTVDGDEINNEFFIKYWGYLKAEIIIVDRWGKVVFESSNFLSDKWSPEVADGVCFYTLKMMRPDTQWDQFTGMIQII